MCQLKSGIILKNRVFVPEYDSHTEMIKELGITDDYLNASKTFIRFELLPKDNDIFSEIDGWKLVIDQDIIPEWYSEEEYRPQIVEAVKKWAANHIFIDDKYLRFDKPETFFIKKCNYVKAYNSATVEAYHSATVEAYDSATVKAYNSATVEAYNSATVEAYHSATVEAYDSATVKAYNSATVEAYDSATVEAYHSATVKAYHSATVEAYDSATVKAYHSATVTKKVFSSVPRNNITLSDNATFKDCKEKIIYQCGDWKFISVKEKKTDEMQ